MNSNIYIGTIEHRRYTPVSHKLSYPVYMYGFDLGDLPRLNRRYPFFGYNRKAITAIHDKDYLSPGHMPIQQKINGLLSTHGVSEPAASVTTITSARYLNYVFNPVNFHYCFSREKKLIAIIAEVNNTYGERHPYVLTRPIGAPDSWPAAYRAQKAFHVSPFNTVDGAYQFTFSAPGNRLEIRITLIRDGETIMEALLKANAVPMTPTNHMTTLLRYPLTPHLNIPRIYAHAFKLFFQKKLTFNDKPAPRSAMTIYKQHPNIIEAVSMRLVLAALKKIKKGRLTLTLPDRTIRVLGNPDSSRTAELTVRDFNFFPRIALDGEIGLGESYMAGEWDAPDLAATLKLLIDNRDEFSDGNLVFSALTRIREKLAHDRRKNTVKNTPENIQAHYDLSNEMYTLFLDRHMIYSCGLFLSPEDTLGDAQENKMKRILEQADVGPDHHLLEIGCGWGGFAVFAAKHTGCRVTGITVSRAQYDRACQRVEEEGLQDRITILLQDYRHARGSYDRIVSIEMIEAVGPQFFSTYFEQCRRLLKPGGKMVFQAITIEDDRYERYCRERDWIQKHIFPGGHLPCLKVLRDTISGHTDFRITDIHHMGRHYADTLALWRERFRSSRDAITRMDFDREFFRKWIYYFSVCQAGFLTPGIDNIQVTLDG